MTLSQSLLQALGRNPSRTSAIPIHPGYTTPPTSTSSTFPDEIYSPDSPFAPDSSSSRAASSSYNVPLNSSRSVSSGTTSAAPGGTGAGVGDRDKRVQAQAQLIKRPEDVFKIVKDRLFSWSYMMQWYQGCVSHPAKFPSPLSDADGGVGSRDVHWFNTVKVTRTALETSLGPMRVDGRARNFFMLGASLSLLFDISVAADFLKALLKLLDDWEAWTEGNSGSNKGVVSNHDLPLPNALKVV